MGSRVIEGLPLRFVLIVPFAMILIVSVSLISFLSFQNGTRAVNDLANQLLAESADHVTQYLDSYLAIPSLINNLNQDSLRLGQLNVNEPQAMQQELLAQLIRLENVAAITYASEQRDYIGVARDVLDTALVYTGSSEQTHFALESYEAHPEGSRGRFLSTYAGYDPTIRPWYQAAVTAGQPTWTPIFIWSNNAGIGMDAVTPIYAESGEPAGVLDVSLYLSEISRFLRNVPDTKDSLVFIVDEDGLLVAASTIEEPYLSVDGTLQRLDIRDSPDVFIKAAGQTIEEQFGDWSAIPSSQQIHFEMMGQQIAQIIPYQKAGLRWWVGIVLPEDTYMASINSLNRSTALIVIPCCSSSSF
jgi:hypothetical protein